MLKEKIVMGLSPEEAQPGTPVWYRPCPGHVFAGVVETDPWQLGHGEWVCHLRDMEPAYTSFASGKTRVVAAGLFALARRENA